MPSTKPTNVISNHEAIKMIKYHKRLDSPNDSESGHIPWNQFKAYLHWIEEKCSKKNIEITGLEYYFARYNDNPPAGHGKQRTIVIFPTYMDSQGNHVAIDPINSTRDNIVKIRKLISEDAYNNQNRAEDEGCGFNRSNMSPPRNN